MSEEYGGLEVHPAAELFPLLDAADDRYRVLVGSIKEDGLSNPVVLYEGKILDGRNRYRACTEAGIEVRTTTYEGDNPTQHAISLNLGRRDLTDDQRKAIAAEALPMIEEETEARRRAKIGESRSSETVLNSTQSPSESAPQSGSAASRKTAARQFNVSEDGVRRAKALKTVDKEVFEDVKAGKTSLKEAEKTVRRNGRSHASSSMESVLAPGQWTSQAPVRSKPDSTLRNRLFAATRETSAQVNMMKLAEEVRRTILSDLSKSELDALVSALKAQKKAREQLRKALNEALSEGEFTS